MKLINKEVFVCIDCETTGLDTDNDYIVEIAVAAFKNWEIIESFESIINPKRKIPDKSIEIHGINDAMVLDKPTFSEVIDMVIPILKMGVIVGHNISFDIKMLERECARMSKQWTNSQYTIDTVRLARFHDGKQESNSLKNLCEYFCIESSNHHRAMSDVESTIKLFEELSKPFKTLAKMKERLAHPIDMKIMPLGKYKGKKIKDLPINYLKWAMEKNSDQDLHFSICKELKKRKRENSKLNFSPFLNL